MNGNRQKDNYRFFISIIKSILFSCCLMLLSSNIFAVPTCITITGNTIAQGTKFPDTSTLVYKNTPPESCYHVMHYPDYSREFKDTCAYAYHNGMFEATINQSIDFHFAQTTKTQITVVIPSQFDLGKKCMEGHSHIAKIRYHFTKINISKCRKYC